MTGSASRNLPIDGLPIGGAVSRGFEPVRDAFIENFRRRGELGAACCIYQHGEKVVDLWGGVRDRASGEPWQTDTMVVVHSTTKGAAAMVLALLHSRGLLDYDARVAAYWPEFAQAGKDRITVRQLLAHQAGLFAFDEPVNRDVVADLDRLAAIMARQRPAWAPGERQAYHAISLGFYQSELVRRIDPAHRTLGRFFAEEIAAPLGVEFYIGLPRSIPDARLAPLELRAETIAALMAAATPSRHGFFDECFRGPIQFSLGFMKPSAAFPFGHAGAFGFPGAGGSLGYADPEAGIGYGYVTNRMGMHLHGDPRDVALRAALAARG